MEGVVSSGGVAKKRPRVQAGRESERRISPIGSLVTVDAAWRKLLGDYLDENDISTRTFAKRVKTTHGTISNLVTGRHEQAHKDLVARISAAIGVPAPPEVVQSDEAYRRIVEGAREISPEDRETVARLVESLRSANR